MPRQSQDPERVLQRLDWTVIRRLDGLLQGDYRTLFRGFGLELAELREYQLTDDVRTIDWNVTARMQTPYVRQHMEDREVTAWFLLDMSPSVDFGTARVQKRNLLIDFVGVLARLLTRHGNRVGALVFTGGPQQSCPRRGAGCTSCASSRSCRPSRSCTAPRAPTSALSWIGPAHHPAQVPSLPRLGLHERARLGRPLEAGARGTRCSR